MYDHDLGRLYTYVYPDGPVTCSFDDTVLFSAVCMYTVLVSWDSQIELVNSLIRLNHNGDDWLNANQRFRPACSRERDVQHTRE